MKKRLFYGDFILHPLNILAVLLIIFNDFYLKPSKISPLIAGKLSDIGLMIFLPFFLCFFYVFIKYLINSVKISLMKKDIKEDYSLTMIIVLLSLFISGMILILLQISDQFNLLFEEFILFFKNLFYNRRVTGLNLTKDIYDIFMIIFLLIPYFILKKEIK